MRTAVAFLCAIVVAGAADLPGVRAVQAKLPLSLEANRGQTDPQVQFLSRGPGYTLFLTRTGSVMKLGDRAVLRMKLTGANPGAKLEGLERQAGSSNYFIGNDPSQWRTGVPNYAKVRVDDVYPGIDLIYYGNQRELEYDWIVKPGGDPSRIRFKIEGAEPRVDAAGDLVLKTPAGEVRQRKPVVYQGERKIEGGFVVRGRRVSFEVAAYDRSRPLVIDPVLVYSTYLGGSGGDLGFGIAVDGSGNAYVTGVTYSTNFPIVNPLQAVHGGGQQDAFITKISADGSTKLYSTYLGGSGNDIGNALAVDGSGNAYVTGSTTGNFPLANPLQAAYGGGTLDAFVTKISANGSTLLYSTYLGGSNNDAGAGIAVDGSGSAYVTGGTFSTNFPTANPLQAAYGGGQDAFVTKISADGSTKLYSTYLGGSGGEWGSGIAVDGSGNAYVTGITASTNFPTANPLQSSISGIYDAFVTKISADGSTKLYSTYLGGSGGDQGNGIAVDGGGNVYVTGLTYSTDFPTANPLQAANGGGYDAFVTKISANGSTKLYSTYLGGSGGDQGYGIAVDGGGNVYVTGLTYSTDFPTANPLQASNGGGIYDAFVTRISADGSTMLYSTYLGGGGQDVGNALAVDRSGNAYVTGYTYSADFPTANALQAAYGGNGDAFVSVIATPIFTDVNPADFFYNAVTLLYDHHITAGCSINPPMYCPNDNVTRGQMAIFITRSVLGGDPVSYTQTPYFTDVPATYPFFKWIQALRDLNITAGCGPQLYCPDSSITRDQMAVFIIRARYGASATFNYPSTPYFTDVPGSNTFFSWIQKMAQVGITAGCGAQLYCPGNPVTRGQMAIFIMRGAFNQLLPAGTPVISAVSPRAVTHGQTMNVTLTGVNTNFVQGTTQLSAGAGITVNSVTVASGQSLTANLTVSAGAVLGPRSLVATTGAEEAVLLNGLAVQ